MTKQTINLLGGLIVAVILLAGLLLGVLPRLSQASASHHDRDVVARQNDTQQIVISAYARQRAQLPALKAEVVELKQQIAAGPHLEQLIDLASRLPGGAVLRSITPGQAADGAAPAPATGGEAQDGDFQQLPVTIVVTLSKPTAASAVLDGLRAGPRLFAIDRATLASGAGGPAGGGSTLTVAGRVFMAGAEQ